MLLLFITATKIGNFDRIAWTFARTIFSCGPDRVILLDIM
uniref:Uncharacterized protein n=1 Tax=Arundo donax TaxID=35708 RepID=A0A0A9BQ68_ARUDO